jgi:hypothetical protein
VIAREKAHYSIRITLHHMSERYDNCDPSAAIQREFPAKVRNDGGRPYFFGK